MIRPYRDEFYFYEQISGAGVHEIARVPVVENSIGTAHFFIAAKGRAAGRVLLDEPRARFVRTNGSLVVRDATRPEAAHVGNGVSGASLAIEADGTDIVVRVTLQGAATVRVFTLCELRGAHGDDE